MGADVLSRAFAYEREGRCVLPLKAGSKRPALVSWKPLQTRRPTTEEITTWFGSGNRNIGIVTGEISGIVVVDLDGDEGERSFNELGWPVETRTVCTWSGGVHIYYSWPGYPVSNGAGLLPGLDIRGDGGYVAAPPSRVRGCLKCQLYHEKCKCETPEWDFGSYELVVDVPLAPFPGIPEEPKPARRAPRPPRSEEHGNGYAAAALRSETTNVTSAPEGTRNDTLNKAAYSLARFVASGELSREAVQATLLDAAAMAGLSEREARATVRSGLESR